MTGLEPAASGVTGRRSNQLSYTRVVRSRNYDAEAPLSRPDLHFFSTRVNFLWGGALDSPKTKAHHKSVARTRRSSDQDKLLSGL